MDISFHARKKQILCNLSSGDSDKSRKGSVDYPLVEHIDFLNGCDDYVTTSSCSGRIVVYADPGIPTSEDTDYNEQPAKEKRKKGGEWLMVSHEQLKVTDSGEDLVKMLFGTRQVHQEDPTSIENEQVNTSSLVYFKFEPMVYNSRLIARFSMYNVDLLRLPKNFLAVLSPQVSATREC